MMFTLSVGYGQDVNRKVGLGLQASLPSLALSAKFALSESSMIQANMAPFGSGVFSINYYGGRYIYRFPDSNGGTVELDPYVFTGLGALTYKLDLLGDVTRDSFLAYSVGGGAELIVAKKLGISAELSYGRMNVLAGLGVSGIFAGGGFHYYLK